MTKLSIAMGIGCLIAAPALAQDLTGDAAAGEAAFRQCQTCHVVADEQGNVLAGKSAKTGPNLFGVVGRQAGTGADFAYGEPLVKAGEAGLVWDEANMVAYLQDPTAFLRDKLGNSGVRSKMTFKVRDPEDATNLVAYIASLSPTN